MAKDTKDQLLDAATRLFAEKGFYGASIANIADELGLTKQALLHHYGSKEALYAAVLERISDAFARRIAAIKAQEPDPERRLEAALLGAGPETACDAVRERDDLRLLMRELLDNPERAATARRWYLKPFLLELVALTRAVPGLERLPKPEALRLGYQLLGAAHYFAISEATLATMFGPEVYREMREGFADSHRGLIRAAVKAARDPAA